MYTLIILALFTASGALIVRGARQNRRAPLIAGVLLAAATILFFALLSFLGEMLWFESLGYGERFWTVVVVKTGAGVGGALLAWLVAFLSTRLTPAWPRFRRILQDVAVFVGLFWGLGAGTRSSSSSIVCRLESATRSYRWTRASTSSPCPSSPVSTPCCSSPCCSSWRRPLPCSSWGSSGGREIPTTGSLSPRRVLPGIS